MSATARRRDLFQKFTERLWPTELRYNSRYNSREFARPACACLSVRAYVRAHVHMCHVCLSSSRTHGLSAWESERARMGRAQEERSVVARRVLLQAVQLVRRVRVRLLSRRRSNMQGDRHL